jgi:hypothetical protein
LESCLGWNRVLCGPHQEWLRDSARKSTTLIPSAIGHKRSSSSSTLCHPLVHHREMAKT